MSTAAVAPSRVRVAVADTRRLIAEALAALVRTMDRFVVVDVFDGAEPAPAVVAHKPSVLLVGTGADLSASFELVRAQRQIAPHLEIVTVADTLSPELVRFVLDQRLNGLILSDTPPSDLADCLRHVASGHAVLPADWQAVLMTESDDPVGSLSHRQLEVLRLVAAGYSYEEIGSRLFISANTVKFHLRSIYMRLGVRNRVAAARMLTERRRLEPHPRLDPPDTPRRETRASPGDPLLPG